jgi:hypothetical protein
MSIIEIVYDEREYVYEWNHSNIFR